MYPSPPKAAFPLRGMNEDKPRVRIGTLSADSGSAATWGGLEDAFLTLQTSAQLHQEEPQGRF